MKDNRVRIQFDEEVLSQLKEKLQDTRKHFPRATLSNIVNNELKHLTINNVTSG